MPKLMTKVTLARVLLKPKNVLATISKALSSKKLPEKRSSGARNRRKPMEELVEEEKTQFQHIYFKSLSLEDMVETRRTEEEEGKTAKQCKKQIRELPAGKRSSSTASFSFSKLIRKKTRFSFIKWKMNKTKERNIGNDMTRKKEEDKSIENKVKQRGGGGEEGEKEESGEFELCRRRILMGEKCKPLNVSGSLRYDENGILLAEEIWTKDT